MKEVLFVAVIKSSMNTSNTDVDDSGVIDCSVAGATVESIRDSSWCSGRGGP